MPDRGLPPSRRSSAWARTVLPAPVSPVRTFRPGPTRNSARSMSRRFSTRNSWSTPSSEPTGPDGSVSGPAERGLLDRHRPRHRVAVDGAVVRVGARLGEHDDLLSGEPLRRVAGGVV